jgi:hypothetical protein
MLGSVDGLAIHNVRIHDDVMLARLTTSCQAAVVLYLSNVTLMPRLSDVLMMIGLLTRNGSLLCRPHAPCTYLQVRVLLIKCKAP